MPTHKFLQNDAYRFNWNQIGSVANTDGFMIKAGSSYATAISVGAVAGKFMNFYLKSTVTTGDITGMYLRTYAAGAGAGVTLTNLRAFGTVYDVAIGNAYGGHISLNFNASGSITGLGLALRSTLHVPDVVMSGGTYSAAQSEIWYDGTTASMAGVTVASIHRFIVDGASGYTGNVPFVFEMVGLSATQMRTNTASDATHGLRCRINGSIYDILLKTAT